MLVSEIKGDWANGLIANSSLWERNIEDLRPIDVSVFLRQFWGTAEYNEAVHQVEAMIDKGWHAVIDRQVQKTPGIVFFNPLPRTRITLGELNTWLEQTTVVRRRAILFGLETGMPIQEIIGLTWKELRKLPDLSPIALELAEANPRHVRIDYVFWEPLPNMAAAPLFGLGETMFDISQGMGYNALRSLYQDMILIDSKADCEDFIAKMFQ